MNRILCILYIILLGCCLCSCEKDNDVIVFVAEHESSHNTKAHLVPDTSNSAFDVIWDADDNIIVYGDEDNGIFTNTEIYDDENNQVAHFAGSSVTGSNFCSFYPTSIALNKNTFTLPNTQRYRLRSNGYTYDHPMYAQSNDNHLYFRNLCALCVLRINGPVGATISRVTIADPIDPLKEPMSGEFSLSCSGNTLTNIPTFTATNMASSIVLDCSTNPVTLTDDLELFYIYLPPSSHNWLLVGLEYMLPGDNNVYKSYQYIYATSYRTNQFRFERGKWSLIDVDFSNVDSNLVYSTTDLDFAPNDTVINTHAPITKTYDDYTILVDFTPDGLSRGDVEDGANAIRKTLYSEMDKVRPWRGMLFRLAHYGNAVRPELAVSDSRIQADIYISTGVRYKMAIIINSNTNTARIYYVVDNNIRNKAMSISSVKWLSTTNPVPQIGGDQYKPNRYFDGTIHEFKLYNRVFSYNEVCDWIL